PAARPASCASILGDSWGFDGLVVVGWGIRSDFWGNTRKGIRFLGSVTRPDRFRFARSVNAGLLWPVFWQDAPRLNPIPIATAQSQRAKLTDCRWEKRGADRSCLGADYADTG